MKKQRHIRDVESERPGRAAETALSGRTRLGPKCLIQSRGCWLLLTAITRDTSLLGWECQVNEKTWLNWFFKLRTLFFMRSNDCFYYERLVQFCETLVFDLSFCSATQKVLPNWDGSWNAYILLAYFHFSLAQCDFVITERVCRFRLLLSQESCS